MTSLAMWEPWLRKRFFETLDNLTLDFETLDNLFETF